MRKFDECKTVILGAGVSGISAAINLLKNGYSNFVILEANDRIGGRCFTIDYGLLLFCYLSRSKLNQYFFKFKENGHLEYGAQVTLG